MKKPKLGTETKNRNSKKTFEPLSGRMFPRFSAHKTFFRLPISDWQEDFDVALVGVPFDGGVSYRPGARFAPTRVREASSLGRGYHFTRSQSLWNQLRFADAGDCPTVPIDLLATYKRIEKFYDDVLATDKKVIAVGGDHSITLPILRSMSKKHGPVNLIHFDAHLDTYPAAWDCEYYHGSFVRHAIDEGLINPKSTLQIGIRGPFVDDRDLEVVRKNKVQVTTVDDIRIHGLEKFISGLPVFNKGPTYISFDIDCLDPAYAPGTGTPVVGGLTTYETQRILRALKIKNLVGCDIVEVSPPYDHADITALAAMDTMFEMMHLMVASK
jgi:guanidinopropionase